MSLESASGESTDFDFLIGEWRVRHRRLCARLQSCSDWDTFGGQCSCRKVLSGFGNVDDNLIELPSGTYRAVTLRSFDSKSRTWFIWWLDGRRPHALDVPVVGSFVGETGTFIARDSFEGRLILVRFIWKKRASDHPRWEQAFSPDDGTTWETNWIMDFTPQVARSATP